MTQMAMMATDTLQETLVRRCLAFGLAVWPYNNGLGKPYGGKAALRWLRSPWLRQQVSCAITTWASDRNPQPVEIFRGCWLIPLVSTERVPHKHIVVANMFTNVSQYTSEFEAVCDSVGLCVDEGRRSLTAMIQSNSADPHQLKTMLQWCCTDLAQGAHDAVVLDEFSDKLIQSYEESSFLYRLARLLHSCAGATASYKVACKQIQQIMPFQWVVVGFSADMGVQELANQVIIAGELPCPQELFNRSVSDLANQITTHKGTLLLHPQTNELAALVNSEVVVERIAHDGQLAGLLLAGNKGGGDPEVGSNETQFLEAIADFLSVFYESLARFEEQKTLLMGTLQALTASIDAKDRYTCGHSERVSMLGSKLALMMGLDAKQAEQVRIAGLVHDVGKIGIPESVLCKAGRLTDEEFEQIKRHPVIGYEILKEIPPLKDMLPGVLFHHERWDGKGYPQMLWGDQIPLYGRMLACADTFDAMSSTRSYRPAVQRDRVLAEFEHCAGTQFDPDIVGHFVKLDFGEYDAAVQRHRAAMRTFAA